MNGVQVAELIVRPTEGFPGQLPLGGVLENRETLREFDRIAHQVDHRQMAAILGRTRRQVNARGGGSDTFISSFLIFFATVSKCFNSSLSAL